MDVETTIEQLKAEFKTVEFLAGTVGFVIQKGTWRVVLPYAIFNDPNWPLAIVIAVTQLETAPPQTANTPGFDWPPNHGF